MHSSYCFDVGAGEEKAKFHWTKVALLSIVAGTYCGFGFTLCLIVGGNAPKTWLEDSPGLFSLLFGAVGFPFSFTLVGASHTGDGWHSIVPWCRD
jgi:formate/nitrite transporter FocA (FNT family)